MFPKSGVKWGRFPEKAPQTNEPPWGCHYLLPSRLLYSQVCTPTQYIEPISVSVPKKWREISWKSATNEWAPLRVSLSFTFMAASQPSLYTNPVYRAHLCKCSQKVAWNGGDSLIKRHKRMSLYISEYLLLFQFSQSCTMDIYKDVIRYPDMSST